MKLLRLWRWFRDTPPIDAVSPPDPPEWDEALRRRHGLTEIQRQPIASQDGERIVYAFTFRDGGK